MKDVEFTGRCWKRRRSCPIGKAATRSKLLEFSIDKVVVVVARNLNLNQIELFQELNFKENSIDI